MAKVGLMLNVTLLKSFIQDMFKVYEDCKNIGMEADDIRVRVDSVIKTLTNVIGTYIICNSTDCVVEI